MSSGQERTGYSMVATAELVRPVPVSGKVSLFLQNILLFNV